MQEGAHTRSVGIVCFVAALEAAFVFGFDRTAKQWFMSTPPHVLIPHVLETVQHQNYGIIGNIPIPQPIIIALTLFVVLFVAFGIMRAAECLKLRTAVALALLLGGALGNLYDRLVFGYVIDWLLLFGRSAVNMADAFIAAGAMWYLAEEYRTRSIG
jgi:signal peptidase II